VPGGRVAGNHRGSTWNDRRSLAPGRPTGRTAPDEHETVGCAGTPNARNAVSTPSGCHGEDPRGTPNQRANRSRGTNPWRTARSERPVASRRSRLARGQDIAAGCRLFPQPDRSAAFAGTCTRAHTPHLEIDDATQHVNTNLDGVFHVEHRNRRDRRPGRRPGSIPHGTVAGTCSVPRTPSLLRSTILAALDRSSIHSHVRFTISPVRVPREAPTDAGIAPHLGDLAVCRRLVVRIGRQHTRLRSASAPCPPRCSSRSSRSSRVLYVGLVDRDPSDQARGASQRVGISCHRARPPRSERSVHPEVTISRRTLKPDGPNRTHGPVIPDCPHTVAVVSSPCSVHPSHCSTWNHDRLPRRSQGRALFRRTTVFPRATASLWRQVNTDG
jgi:hypothetical protein